MKTSGPLPLEEFTPEWRIAAARQAFLKVYQALRREDPDARTWLGSPFTFEEA